jgi:hypothetical protein
VILAETGDVLGTALTYANLAVLESKRGNHLEAVALCHTSIRLYDEALDRPDPRVSFPSRVLALALLELDRPSEAVAPLERALLLHGTGSYDATERPKTQLALARALWTSGHDRRRAVELATAARTELERSPRASPVELAEVNEWLRLHRP